jgi:hypothetical protein
VAQSNNSYESEYWGPRELRTVSVVFVHIPTLDILDFESGDSATQLRVVNSVFRAMQEVIYKYEGECVLVCE